MSLDLTPNRSIELWRAAIRTRSFVAGVALTVIFLLLAALSFVWTPYDVTVLDIPGRLQGPDSAHLFGTDHFGRDLFSMVMVGARTSIAVAIIAVGIGIGLGVPLGLAAAAGGAVAARSILASSSRSYWAFWRKSSKQAPVACTSSTSRWASAACGPLWSARR